MTAPLHFKRRVVRASKPSWYYAPTSGEGAARRGGRFNPIGVSALYTSFDFGTCAREVRFSLNTDPYTFYYLEVESTRILDLSGQMMRDQLDIKWADLECPNWESKMHKGIVPSTHKIAKHLSEQRYHGIVVPSFAPGASPDDLNLVLWSWKQASEKGKDEDECAWVSVLSPSMLPQDRSSWQT